MPRSAADLFTDRRRRSWKIGFKDRRKGDRSSGVLTCIGAICRQDLPWREVITITVLALLFLVSMSWFAALLPGEVEQTETLPIEIVVQLRKEPVPEVLSEPVVLPAPVAPVVEVQPREEIVVEVAPTPEPVPQPVVRSEPLPQPAVEIVQEVPREPVVERVIEPPKKEIVLAPLPVKKSYQKPKQRVETVPEQQVVLKQPEQVALFTTKAPKTTAYVDRAQQTDTLRPVEEPAVALKTKTQVNLAGPTLKKNLQQPDSSNVPAALPQAAALNMQRQTVAVVKPRSSFSGYATDQRPDREQVQIAERPVAIAPKSASVSIAKTTTSKRTYEVKANQVDQLGASETTTVFAAQQDQHVELSGVSKLNTVAVSKNRKADSLPSGEQVFQVGSDNQQTISTAHVGVASSSSADRPEQGTAFSGDVVPELDGTSLTTIDPSLFRSLQQMKMRACLDPAEEGILRTRLATLLQRDGRCSNGQVAFDVKSPQDGYSVHLNLYNPGDVEFTNRCMAYNQAIECFANK
ncbi:MAG TPA: hypothetical protein VJ974_02385 [Geopsychrobacteraceae bacterium]|nr:hypothetical protein [Geopsychrobacteraceae bacterium]